jgi:hypothetical protein
MSAILALATAAWSRAAAWVAAAGAALALLVVAYGAGRRDGRGAARVETLERAARAREIRDEVDRAVDRTGDPADELRRDWRRGL